MTTPYLTKQAEEIAEHTEELKQLTARIKWQVADMKAKAARMLNSSEFKNPLA